MKNKKELAQQLRVGNLLYYKNTKDIAKVELIHNSHFDCRDEYGSFTPNGNYEPITLTEEILLKCGFEINEGKTLFEHSKCGLKLMDIVGLYYRANFPIKADVTSVHQLQNLYHALTGQELKIEL